MGHDSVTEVTWTQVAGLCGTGTVEMKPRCGLPTRRKRLYWDLSWNCLTQSRGRQHRAEVTRLSTQGPKPSLIEGEAHNLWFLPMNYGHDLKCFFFPLTYEHLSLVLD